VPVDDESLHKAHRAVKVPPRGDDKEGLVQFCVYEWQNSLQYDIWCIVNYSLKLKHIKARCSPLARFYILT
jgi:hypothetical protein